MDSGSRLESQRFMNFIEKVVSKLSSKTEQNRISVVPLVTALIVVVVATVAFAQVPVGNWWNSYVAPHVNELSALVQGTQAQDAVVLYKPALEYEKAVVNAVKKAAPAVVAITVSKNVPIVENCTVDPFGNLPPEVREFFGDQLPQISQPCERGTRLQEVGGGSGFIVSADGMIVTNKHVVSDTGASYTVFLSDGRKFQATVLARDPVQDIAILKVNTTGLPTVELGNSDSVELGQTTIAIGNALGEFKNTVSVGVVSGLYRNITASGGNTVEQLRGLIQTDAAINSGNSGGPLLNLKGQVIGVNTAVAQGAQSIGFALPINRVKRDVTSVKNVGSIAVPYIGVRYVMITDEIAKTQKLAVTEGALVRGNEDGPAITANSPAAKAGLKNGDIITKVSGVNINSEHPLGDVINERAIGERVVLQVRRGGEDLFVPVTLEKRP